MFDTPSYIRSFFFTICFPLSEVYRKANTLGKMIILRMFDQLSGFFFIYLSIYFFGRQLRVASTQKPFARHKFDGLLVWLTFKKSFSYQNYTYAVASAAQYATCGSMPSSVWTDSHAHARAL